MRTARHAAQPLDPALQCRAVEHGLVVGLGAGAAVPPQRRSRRPLRSSSSRQVLNSSSRNHSSSASRSRRRRCAARCQSQLQVEVGADGRQLARQQRLVVLGRRASRPASWRRAPAAPATAVEVGVDASSLPRLCSSASAVFSPTPGTPGMLSTLSPISARKSTICSGGTPNFARTPSTSSRVSVIVLTSVTCAVDQLRHVLVAGGDQHRHAVARWPARQRADHIVGLDAVARTAAASPSRGRCRAAARSARATRPASAGGGPCTRRIDLVAEGLALGVEHHRDRRAGDSPCAACAAS